MLAAGISRSCCEKKRRTKKGLGYKSLTYMSLETTPMLKGQTKTIFWAAFKTSRLTDVKWCQPKMIVKPVAIRLSQRMALKHT
jgi:hypothetical protein